MRRVIHRRATDVRFHCREQASRDSQGGSGTAAGASVPSRGLIVTNGTFVLVKLLDTMSCSTGATTGAAHGGCAVFCTAPRLRVSPQRRVGTGRHTLS